MTKLITSWSPVDCVSSPSFKIIFESITDSNNSKLKFLGGVSLISYEPDEGIHSTQQHQLDFWSKDRKWFILRGNLVYLLQGEAFASSDELIMLDTNEADELALPKKFLLSLSEVEQVVSEFLESGGIELSDRWKPMHPYY